MKHSKTKALRALLLLALISCLAVQVAMAQSPSVDAKNKALAFMTDVLQLYTTKSTTSLAVDSISYSESSGVPQESIKYNIKAADTDAGAISFMFRDNALVFCSTAELKDTSTLNAISSNDVLDKARGIMQRYATFAKDNGLLEMANLLSDVKEVTNTTVKAGTAALEITNTADSTVFWWKHIINGVEYNEVQLVFEDKELLFSDYLSRNKMGNTDINISKEQAINAAFEQVKNYSYTVVGNVEGKETEFIIKDFNISRERTTATIVPCERKDGLLYPRWMAEVYLETTYPGYVYGFRVDFWADSGELLSINPLAVGSNYPIDSSNAQIQQESNAPTSISTYVIALVASIALIIATITLIRRRHK